MDQELTEQFNENMRQLSEMMAQLNSTMAGTVKSMNDASVASKNAATSTKQSADSQTNSTSQVVTGNTKLQEAQKKSSDIMAESAKRFADAGYAAGSALKSFTQAALSGEEGFKKYGSAVGSLGNSALALGSNFGKLGTFAGIVTKAFSSAAELWFKQADNLLSASDSISKLGAANRFTTNDIMKMGHGAGLASWELDKLIKPMKSVSGGFIGLAGSQAEGIKRFGEMTDVTIKTRQEFQRLGFDNPERIQAQADFISLMNKSGAAFSGNLKTQQGLQKASLEYTKNLVELASITGTDVETAKQQREIQMATMEVALQQNKWEAERIRAEKEHDAATLERIEKEKRGFEQFNNDLKQAGLSQEQIVLAQNRFLTGVISSAQSAQFEMRETNLDEFIKKAKEGTLKQGELAEAIKQGVNKTLSDVGHLTIAISEEAQKAYGLNKELVGRSTQLMSVNLTTVAGQAAAAIQENAAGKGPVAEDPAQKIRNALTAAEQEAKTKVDAFAASFNPLLGNNGAMKLLAGTATAAAVALGAVGVSKLVGGIASLFNGRQGSKGNPMYVKMAGSDETSGPAERAARKKSGAIDESKLLDKNGKPLTGAARSSRMAKLERDAASALGKTSKLAKIGTILGKTTTALAVVGSAVSAYSDWSDISAQANAGEISQQEATKRKAEAVGGAGGAAAGGAAGAALGSILLPGIGTVLGGMLGTALGEKLGKAGADKLIGVIDTAMAPLSAITTGIGSTIDSLKPAVTWITKAFTDVSGIMFSISKLVFFPFYWAGLKVSEGFKQISTGISNWMKEHPKVVAAVKWIGEGLSWLGDLVKKLFGWLGEKLGSWNKGLSDWVGSLYGEDETKQSPNKAQAAAKTPPASPAKSAQSDSGWFSWLTGSPEADAGQKSQIREEAKTNSDKVVKSAVRNTTSSEKTEKATVVFSKSTNKFTDQITTLSKFIEMQSKSIKDFSSSVLTFKETISDLKNYVDTNLLGGYGTQFGGDVDRILATIRQRESSGNYKAEAKGSSASGAYQFIDSTWQSLTKKYNIGTEFKRAMDAPNAVQDQVASAYVQDILKQSGGDVSKVPLAWYTGNIQGKMSQSALAANRGLTPQMYQQKWMEDFSKTRPSGAASGQSSGIIALGRSLQSQGFRVDEHPSFLPYTPGAHKGKGHAEGRAIDVNIGKGVNEATDPEAGARMDALAQQLASDPNLTVLWRQAGHFDHMHVETKRGVQAAKGGVFAGSRAGYPATLHGTEMVAPLNLDSVLMKLAKTSSSTPEGQELLGETKKIAGTGASDIDKVTLFNKEIAGMITSKLDKMIDILDDGNNTRHKILQHSR